MSTPFRKAEKHRNISFIICWRSRVDFVKLHSGKNLFCPLRNLSALNTKHFISRAITDGFVFDDHVGSLHPQTFYSDFLCAETRDWSFGSHLWCRAAVPIIHDDTALGDNLWFQLSSRARVKEFQQSRSCAGGSALPAYWMASRP